MRFATYFFAYGPAVFIIALSIPMVLGKVSPNRVYGFRTPKTLSSPSIWYPANRISGWYLISACVIAILFNSAVLVVGSEIPLAWFGLGLSVPLLLAAGAAFLYLRRL